MCGDIASVWALRNEQSRVRAFFRYCHNAGMIPDNPGAKLSTIKVRDEDYRVCPFTEREYKQIGTKIRDTWTEVTRVALKYGVQPKELGVAAAFPFLNLPQGQTLLSASAHRVFNRSKKKKGRAAPR